MACNNNGMVVDGTCAAVWGGSWDVAKLSPMVAWACSSRQGRGGNLAFVGIIEWHSVRTMTVGGGAGWYAMAGRSNSRMAVGSQLECYESAPPRLAQACSTRQGCECNSPFVRVAGGYSACTVYNDDGAGWHALTVDSNTRIAADGVGVAASGEAAAKLGNCLRSWCENVSQSRDVGGTRLAVSGEAGTLRNCPRGRRGNVVRGRDVSGTWRL